MIPSHRLALCAVSQTTPISEKYLNLQKESLLALFVFFIPLAEFSNRALTFIALFLRAILALPVPGAEKRTLIKHSSSVLP